MWCLGGRCTVRKSGILSSPYSSGWSSIGSWWSCQSWEHTAGLRNGTWFKLVWRVCFKVYLPGSNLEMSAQRFPSMFWAWQMMVSSSRVHLSFFTAGFRWLCQRSRHCFPLRVCMCLAMRDQCLTPYFCTSSMTWAGSDITLLWCLTVEVLCEHLPGCPPVCSMGLWPALDSWCAASGSDTAPWTCDPARDTCMVSCAHVSSCLHV